MESKRETSRQSFHEIKARGLLTERRFEVYSILHDNGPCSAAQVVDWWRKRHGPVSNSGTIASRLTELRRQGVVRECGKGPCPLTGKKVIMWDVVDGALPVPLQERHREICQHCKGTGTLTTLQAHETPVA